jgi:hypothetical protein
MSTGSEFFFDDSVYGTRIILLPIQLRTESINQTIFSIVKLFVLTSSLSPKNLGEL